MSEKTLRHLRWYICGLLFLVTTINYLDRQAVSVLNPILKKEVGWDEAGYGWIMFSFQLAYAIMLGVSGRLLDLFGVRAGLAWAVAIWSLAAMAHAAARTPFGFAVARFALGLGEAANFPAAIKAVAEWFPKRERALATGIFNSGTNIGIMLAPLIVWLATHTTWRSAFLVTGAIGFAWLVGWLAFYRPPEEHPRLSTEEHDLILSDRTDEGSAVRIPWTSLLRYRQAWAFLLGKLLTDPVWWFYLFWLPPYLNKERGVSALTGAVLLIVPYVAADIGSIGGGWLSGWLIGCGWPIGRSRFLALLIFALCMPAAIVAVHAHSLYTALALISLATSAHQAWSANLFTLASDLFPKRAVGSVVGLGGMCGAIGGMFMTLLAGGVLQWFGSYTLLFVLAGIMHPLAFMLIVGFAGRECRPARIDESAGDRPSPLLIGVGAALTVIGSLMVWQVSAHWEDILAASHSVGTAAGGLVGSSGVLILGLVLAYAGRGRRAAATISTN